MKSFSKISQKLNTITQENLNAGKRIIDFRPLNSSLWKGAKRYAH